MSNIKELFIFNNLEEKQKDNIISTFNTAKHYKKGEEIYSTDNFSKAIGYVVNGTAYAIANNNNNLLMKKFTSGMCFGVAAIFGENESYSSTIIAETETDIIFITEQQLKCIFLEYPNTAINYITFLSDKIRFLNSKISVISCASAEDTLYKYLVSVVDKNGYALLPKSITLLSRMLGIGRATLYRCLDSLENNGKITRENNKLKVITNEKID